jgi:hypothetical protein
MLRKSAAKQENLSALFHQKGNTPLNKEKETHEDTNEP